MNRELRFNELRKLFEALGCQVEYAKGWITIKRGVGTDHRFCHIHAHKGEKDSFDKSSVRTARRRMGFAGMSDEEFYAPLG